MRQGDCWSLELHLSRLGKPFLSNLANFIQVLPQFLRAHALKIQVEKAISLTSFQKRLQLFFISVEKVIELDGVEVSRGDMVIRI